MTKEEAIKYLQQLYSNGGHCWLDEQRIEAIGMAVKALQEELVSKDLEEASYNFVMNNYGNPKEPLYKFDQRCFKAGAQWQQKKTDKDMIEALRTEYEKGRADVIVEIEKCYEKAITAEAQTYLIKDLLDRLKTKK